LVPKRLPRPGIMLKISDFSGIKVVFFKISNFEKASVNFNEKLVVNLGKITDTIRKR
jgi:hypothetical protein